MTPSELDFGEQAVGTSVTEALTVLNAGDDTLTVSGAALDDASAPYVVVADGHLVLAPGDTTTVLVVFAPVAEGDAAAALLVTSNDPDAPEVAVPLSGSAAAAGPMPEIWVSPCAYDFGDVGVTCEDTITLTVASVGTADLVVDSLVTLGANFTVDLGAAGALPWTLAPGTSVDLTVVYAPDAYDLDEATLYVELNDPVQPTVPASFTGEGAELPTLSETFTQTGPDGPLDVLVALDGSDSMDADRANVRDNLETLLAALGASDVEWRLAVVMADDGCVAGPRAWIDPAVPAADRVDALDAMLAGDAGFDADAGFALLTAATSAENVGSGGCNAGLVRADAALELVGVTDDREASGEAWLDVVAAFQATKADPDDVRFHAVGGDYPSGCGDNAAAVGWYEAALSTGGAYLSLCATDWGEDLDLTADSAPLTSFDLSRWPDGDTIVVTVYGEVVTTGWAYASGDNALEFDDEHVPEAGAEIVVTYVPDGACDSV